MFNHLFLCIYLNGDSMSNINYAFIITLLAGLSTLIGFLFIYIKKDRVGVISSSLGFAGGVMISVSILDLIPNSFILIKNNYVVINSIILVFIGLIIGITISNIIKDKVEYEDKKLYKLGIITMLVIILHNIPEGIATFITTTNNIKLGMTLAIAIALHNIPEGIAISIPIYYSTSKKSRALLYTFISAISEPLGALLSYLFLSKYINESILGILYSIIAGMMLNIGYNELYKESKQYNKYNSIKYLIIGSLIMIINHLLFG